MRADKEGLSLLHTYLLLVPVTSTCYSYFLIVLLLAPAYSQVRADKDGLSLLHTNMGAGHAGKSGRFDRLEEVSHRLCLEVLVCVYIYIIVPGTSSKYQ